MKKQVYLIINLVLFNSFLIAQAPQAFKYQAVARDVDGNFITDQNVTFRITILQGIQPSIVVYSEIHSINTNGFGLATLNIGRGIPVNNIFTAIDWSIAPCYLQIELDTEGDSEFIFMGISEMMSVPYSLYSEKAKSTTSTTGIQRMTSFGRDSIANPEPGRLIYNTTTNCLNCFNGSGWFSMCGTCTPVLIGTAEAGLDQFYFGNSGASFTASLEGNFPMVQDIDTVYAGSGTWSIIEGTGGNISNIHNPESDFSGIIGSHYLLRWTTGSRCDSTFDEVRIMGFPDCGILQDIRDGNNYNTVRIGNQCWMAQNLDIGTEIDYHIDQSNNGIIEKYCYPGNPGDPSNCSIYGGLYQWSEMMQYTTTPGVQGICPPTGGWHIPTDDEWTILTDFLGGSEVAGGRMKETGLAHWEIPNTGATDESGFTALPAGDKGFYFGGNFEAKTFATMFWSSTEFYYPGDAYARIRQLAYDTSQILSVGIPVGYGNSVRRVKNLSAP